MGFLLVILACLLTSAGQLFQKQAVESWRGEPLSLALLIRSPWLWAAVTSLGLGIIFWLLVLQQLPVSIAYPMLSLNFVFITLASRIWFHEIIDARHCIGILLIIAGIVVLRGH
ncbi:4-amino-4-deoxy-L-arabinose-phospho-UDP flippase [Marinobacter halodurans]|uniref:4-amino-4-deoxy-L-arabinose-phospho-UDP flippase n=1 Tax=Marinobacter halodurans TaxID=2528979 RepID=A0ABY1ZGT7_9GAMM|nr:4-amino-4-deoxy-L-arabinose-phosphoundecaprenol flippase subunit ArnE [Marinobacter halodurans]TBW47900.1 4-amino-4-deoxy-L-arabinose-phospho-UDP flippase [Marinobacter halodurans]